MNGFVENFFSFIVSFKECLAFCVQNEIKIFKDLIENFCYYVSAPCS